MCLPQPHQAALGAPAHGLHISPAVPMKKDDRVCQPRHDKSQPETQQGVKKTFEGVSNAVEFRVGDGHLG